MSLCKTDAIAWGRRTVDLRAYAGQSVLFRIQVDTNASKVSHVFYDDVSFVATP